MRVGIVIILLLFSGGLFSQMSYRAIDSTSYAMYLQSDWKGLKNLAEDNTDHYYHYLNIRFGIAHYYLGDFKTASEYLKKALEQSSNHLAQEYLYWCFSFLGYSIEAEEIYGLLSDEVKKRINLSKMKKFESLYTELGQIISQDQSSAENLNFLGLQANFNLNRKHQLAAKYSYANQSLIWGKFSQNEIGLQSTYHLKKGWKLNSNLSYFGYQSDLNYYLGDTIVGEPFTTGIFTVDSTAILSTRYNGSLNQNSLFIGTGVKKWFNRFLVQGQIHHFYSQNKNNFYQILGGEYLYNVDNGITINTSEFEFYDTIPYQSPSNINQTQIGASIDYSIMGKNISLQPGIQIAYHLSDSNRVSIVPQLKLNSGRVGLGLSFIQKKEQSLFIMSGSNFVNTRNDINYRISSTLRFKINDRLDLYLTGQFDEQKDFFSLRTYNTYSIFTGLNLKL